MGDFYAFGGNWGDVKGDEARERPIGSEERTPMAELEKQTEIAKSQVVSR